MKKGKKNQIKGNTTKGANDINLPEKDIKVEKGQLTFLPAFNKIIKKKK